MNKKERREAAVKKAKQRKTIIICVCAAVVVIAVVFAVVTLVLQSKNRVFTDGHQKLTLKYNGTFTAELAHETRKGTFTESEADGSITVTFTSDGASVNGAISDGVLTIPEEWQDDHGHGSYLWLE